MSKKHFCIIASALLALTVLIFYSCAISEAFQEVDMDISNNNCSINTRAVWTSDLDSLYNLHKTQSDVKAMLLDQIKNKEGVFQLEMTLNDALSIGATDSLYEWISACITGLNKEFKGK